jgi:hypothetical protein
VNYADDINSGGKLLAGADQRHPRHVAHRTGQQKLMEETLGRFHVNDCVRMVTSKATDGGVRLIVENKGCCRRAPTSGR